MKTMKTEKTPITREDVIAVAERLGLRGARIVESGCSDGAVIARVTDAAGFSTVRIPVAHKECALPVLRHAVARTAADVPAALAAVLRAAAEMGVDALDREGARFDDIAAKCRADARDLRDVLARLAP